MKYILVIGDGMSDVALKELNGKTPLQVANHPNMDRLTADGICGLLKTIPHESNPGTEVAFLSIFGYDPLRFNPGRGPLEAAGIGIELEENDIAMRCNLVTVENGILKDHSAGHITTEESRKLLETLREHFEKKGLIEFYPGVSYRHLLVLRGGKYQVNIRCTPPHEALNKPVSEILVKATDDKSRATAEMINQLMLRSQKILDAHEVNRARVKSGERPGNMIWPWGQGRRPKISTLKETYGISGAAISAVDIVNGIGRYLGMDIVKVPGATGYIDTNYEAKADYALKSLEKHDMVLVHVEAPDETSHVGRSDLKIKAIEDIDRRLLGRIMKGLKGDYSIAVMPDHTTQTSDGSHSRDPVPFTIFSTDRRGGDKIVRFDEKSVQKGSLGVVEGVDFIKILLKRVGINGKT